MTEASEMKKSVDVIYTCKKTYNITTYNIGDTTHLLVSILVVVHPANDSIAPPDWPYKVTGNLLLHRAVTRPTP